jgi:hypothetical protein
MPRLISKGKCNLCDGTFSKSAMSRHLTACRSKQQVKSSGAPGAQLLHLVVEGDGLPEYWMHLEAPARIKLKHLDDFLRDTWLECCGHLSAFTIEDRRYNNILFDEFKAFPEDRNMNVELGRVLRPGLKFEYEYDFGSTTALTLRVVAEYKGAAEGKTIKVLARNDAPPIPCASCDQMAAQVCSMCVYSSEGWLCDDCAGEHECDEDAFLPVVNSPRVGVCGYEG